MRTLGVTLVELMIAVALVGLLAAIAVPSYESYLRKAKIAAAKKDILEISLRLDRVFMAVGAYPPVLPLWAACPWIPGARPTDTYPWMVRRSAKSARTSPCTPSTVITTSTAWDPMAPARPR